MNPIDYREGKETKSTTWRSKIYDLTRKIAWRGSKEREKALRSSQAVNMPITGITSRSEPFKNMLPTEGTSQIKNIDNGFGDVRGKYVLRPRLSWTGLYGKEPWPRERKLWEKALKN
jgi:hypothetical protein